jgi:hypothetical protein
MQHQLEISKSRITLLPSARPPHLRPPHPPTLRSAVAHRCAPVPAASLRRQLSKISVCQPRGAHMSKIIKLLLPLALIGGFNLRRPNKHLRSEAKDKVNPNSPVRPNFSKWQKFPRMPQNATRCNTKSRYRGPVVRSFQPGRLLPPLPAANRPPSP